MGKDGKNTSGKGGGDFSSQSRSWRGSLLATEVSKTVLLPSVV